MSDTNFPMAAATPFRWISQQDADRLRRNEKVGSASVSLLNKGGGKRVGLYLEALSTAEPGKPQAAVGWLVRGLTSYCYVDSPEKPNFLFFNCTGFDKVVSTEPRFAAPIAASVESSCDWRLVDDQNMPGTYTTSCGRTWSFVEGNLSDNGMHYCMECGKKVADTTPAAEPDEAEPNES